MTITARSCFSIISRLITLLALAIVAQTQAQPLPQLALPPIDVASPGPFPPSLITAQGLRIPLPPSATLTLSPASRGFDSNYPGAWFVNFPGVEPAAVAGLAGEPSRIVRNWYWLSPGETPKVDFDFVTAPAIAVKPGKPTFIVSATDPRASNDNIGSPDAPLRTIRAALARAQAGDVIHVLAGVYREQLAVTRSGIFNRPIRVVGVPNDHGQWPVISGNWSAKGLAWKPVDNSENLFKANVGGFLFGTAFADDGPLLEQDAIDLIESRGVVYSWGAIAMATRASAPSLRAALGAPGKLLEADSSGWFDLAAATDAKGVGNIVIARVYVYAAEPLVGDFRIEGDFRSSRQRGARPASLPNRYRCWLNGEPIAALVQGDGTNDPYTHVHSSISAEAGELLVGTSLKAGWNELLFQLDTSIQPRKTRFAVRLPRELKLSTIDADRPAGNHRPALIAIQHLTKLQVVSSVGPTSEPTVFVRLDPGNPSSMISLDLPFVQGPLVTIKANFIEWSGFEFRGGSQSSQQGMVEVHGHGNLLSANRFIRPDVRAIGIRTWDDQKAEPTIVRQNWIQDPGHVGIGASGETDGAKFNLDAVTLGTTLPGRGRYVIEDNIIINSNRNAYPVFWESGCIKVVRSSGAVIRGNACIGNNGTGIWLDWENFNNRVEGNFIYGAYGCAICVEVSPGPNLVANNLIVATRPGPFWFRAGILAWDGTRTWAQHNTVDGASIGGEWNGIKGTYGINLQGNSSVRLTRWQEASRDATRQFASANLTFGSVKGVSISPLVKNEYNFHDATTMLRASADIPAVPGLYRDRSHRTSAPMLLPDKHDFSGLLRELADPSAGAFRSRTPAITEAVAILEVEFEDGAVKRKLFPR